jgi:hypothetical protein
MCNYAAARYFVDKTVTGVEYYNEADGKIYETPIVNNARIASSSSGADDDGSSKTRFVGGWRANTLVALPTAAVVALML